MNYWMVKTEPASYSWNDLAQKGEDVWDGVRNYQARNFLRAMRPGDPILFYHSGNVKAVVGIAEVASLPFPDPKDSTWEAILIKPMKYLSNSVSLGQIKAENQLSGMLMLKQSRLSVMSVTPEEFRLILKMSL
jgi:predicted RNA-binding protein with PUA-like domain